MSPTLVLHPSRVRRVKPALPLPSARRPGRRARRPWIAAHRPASPIVANRIRRVRLPFTCLALMAAAAGCDRDSQIDPPAASQQAASPVTRTSQDGPVKLTVHVDRDALGASDRLELTLSIEAQRGVQVRAPVFQDVLGPFAIVNENKPEPSADDLIVRLEHAYTLEGVLPGDQEIPPITVEYTDDRPRADGSQETVTGTVATEPIRIRVDVGLADVKGPATLPMSLPRKIIRWGAGLLAAMIGVAMFARWWRKRRAERAEQAPMARRLVAHQWALAELDKLVAEDLIAAGRVQEFYYRVNGLIRRYIELRFDLAAAEQTSEEFLRALQDTPELGDRHMGLLRDFTAACDPVKYAAILPQGDDVDWVIETARRFVRETALSGNDAAGPRSEPVEARGAA